MSAGDLDRSVVVQRHFERVEPAGTVVRSWQSIGELRAEVVSLASLETAAAFGTIETASLLLRTRYLPSLTTADRLVFAGEFFNIKSISEIGRRRGLELRVERAR